MGLNPVLLSMPQKPLNRRKQAQKKAVARKPFQKPVNPLRKKVEKNLTLSPTALAIRILGFNRSKNAVLFDQLVRRITATRSNLRNQGYSIPQQKQGLAGTTKRIRQRDQQLANLYAQHPHLSVAQAAELMGLKGPEVSHSRARLQKKGKKVPPANWHSSSPVDKTTFQPLLLADRIRQYRIQKPSATDTQIAKALQVSRTDLKRVRQSDKNWIARYPHLKKDRISGKKPKKQS